MSHSMRNLLSTHLSPDFMPQTNDCFTGGFGVIRQTGTYSVHKIFIT